MHTTLASISILAYVISAFILSARLGAPHRMRRRALVFSSIALAAHAFALIGVFTETSWVKINLFLSLAIITLILSFLNSVRGDHPASLLIRPAIYGLAALSLVLVLIIPAEVGRPIHMSPIFALHMSLALIASALLTLATFYGVQLLYVNRLLKQKSAKAVSERMPPLLSIEQYFFRLLTTGTIVLLIAVTVGFIYMDDLFARGQLHKTIFSLAALIAFGSVLTVHYWRGLRGRIAVYYTLLASSLLIIGYFGSRFVRDILLT